MIQNTAWQMYGWQIYAHRYIYIYLFTEDNIANEIEELKNNMARFCPANFTFSVGVAIWDKVRSLKTTSKALYQCNWESNIFRVSENSARLDNMTNEIGELKNDMARFCLSNFYFPCWDNNETGWYHLQTYILKASSVTPTVGRLTKKWHFFRKFFFLLKKRFRKLFRF